MPGVEEPELSDEELLGAATLAKISSRLNVVDIVGLEALPADVIDEVELEELALEELEEELAVEELEEELEEEQFEDDEIEEETTDEAEA
jgi:DNA topoisomerase VI subunit A